VTARYRVALLGHGIGPSLTPPMHEREARHLGLDYTYDIVDLLDRPDVDLGTELDRLEDAGYAAVNVTHPFKRAVLAHVDGRSDMVDRIGSANLVLLGHGERCAHNTDASGFRAGLEAFLGDGRRGRVLQVGAGGAGLATAYSLLSMGFEEVVVHDLLEEAAEELVARFADLAPRRIRTSGGEPHRWLDGAEPIGGVVHVTPMGMAQHPGVALEPERMPRDSWLAEVVYRPLETELVRRARAHGLRVLDGGAMAVGQAVDSLRLITGREPDRARMDRHFHELVH
jgi:shikimate dehydrogenase